MRFLIALLALITGFTAADAARPQGAEAQASVALAVETVFASADKVATLKVGTSFGGSLSNENGFCAIEYASPDASSPVSRADISRT